MDNAAISFVLNGKSTQALRGETILQVAKREGVAIPYLCFKEGLAPEGNCRACMVEIAGERVLAPSCCRAPTADMKVETRSARAVSAQKGVLELLLADAGKSEIPAAQISQKNELIEWANALGITHSRYPARAQPAPDVSHPAMAVNLDACIQCTRCVRACRDAQVNDVIGMAWRGAASQIVFDQDDAMGASSCVGCGECVQACPTGALSNKLSLPSPFGRGEVARNGGEGKRTASGLTASEAAFPHPNPLPEGEGVESALTGGEGVGSALPQGEAQKSALLRGVLASGKQTIPSVCPYCGVGCQLNFHVENNKITHVTGRDGPANASRLCVKGRYGFDYVHNAARLTKPLIRIKPKQATFSTVPENWREHFREASWDEALEFAAQGLLKAKHSSGPKSLAGFGSAKGSNEEAYLFQKLVRVGFGSNNVDHCTRLCHASSVAALLEGIGSGAVSNPVRDVQFSEVIFLIGANPTSNHPVAASFIKNAVKRGAQLIIADPRRTDMARLATHVVQFKADTDVVLLNAMLHTIIDEDLVDEQFIAERTENYAELKANVKDCSPEAMSEICGIPAAQIREVSRLFASSKASMILWGMGVSQHTHGTDNARCLIALSLITGQIGKPGSGLHPLRGQNNVQGASDAGLIPMMLPDYQRVDDESARLRFEHLWNTKLDAQPGLTVVETLKAAASGEVKAMYVMGENPAMSDPDLQHAREALASLDHLVVQDIFMTETAWLADVVLPATAWPEKNGTVTNTDRLVQMGRKAIEPPGDAREDLWILNELGKRMGLPWNYDHPKKAYEEMRQGMDSITGISWARLEREGAVVYPCAGEEVAGQPIVFVKDFPRKSGLAKLVPAQYIPAAEQTDSQYPFVLITGRQLEHWHTGAMTRRASVLDALEPSATASLHPLDLLALFGPNCAAGMTLKITSRRGDITLTARADDGIARGTVFIPFAYAEAAANLLTNPVLDPYGKIPEFKYCAVSVQIARPTP
jgi:formate dehydrogenase major subunit